MNKFLNNFIKLNYNKPKRALDLGCGQKTDLNHLEKLGWKITRVDLPETDLNFFYKNRENFIWYIPTRFCNS